MHPSQQELNHWHSSSLGQNVAALEHEALCNYLPSIRGNSLLYSGYENNKSWLRSSQILHKINIGVPNQYSSSVDVDLSSLPFSQNIFDAIVLQHTLETTVLHPKIILAEAWRVLSASGYLVITGFNPWGSLRMLKPFTQNKLPGYHYISIQTIKRWLFQQHAELIVSKSFAYALAYRPISKNLKTTNEKFLQLLFPNAGDIYLVIARKRIVPLTPIKERWRWENLFANKNYGQPTTGRIHHG